MISAEPVDLRRRWLVITLATVVMQFAYWPIALGAGLASETDETLAGASGGLLALGLAMVPFAFMALAFGSRHLRAPGAVLRAMGLFLLVGLPLAVLLNTVVGTMAGLAAGGVVALRREDDVHPVRWRWWAVVAATVYLMVLLVVAPEFALISGAVLPFTVLGLVDQAAETR